MRFSKHITHIFLLSLFVSLIFIVSTQTSAQGTNITFWDMENNVDDVDDYSGIRIVVFFLPTCPHCINELPILEQVDLNYNVTIFMLNPTYESSNETLVDFKTDHSLSDEWVFGYSSNLANDFFNVLGVPVTVVLDDLGRVVVVLQGEVSYSTFQSKIQDAIDHNIGNYNFNYNEFTSISFWDINLSLDNVRNYDDVRMVVFFLPLCSNCINELATVEDLNLIYNFTIFLIDVEKEESNDTLYEFKSNNSISDDWIMGYSTNETNEDFSVQEVPKIIILDEYGRIVRVFDGTASYLDLETSVLDAINLNTDNYRTSPNGTSEDLTRALFIIVGVVISAAVIYFLIKSFLVK